MGSISISDKVFLGFCTRIFLITARNLKVSGVIRKHRRLISRQSCRIGVSDYESAGRKCTSVQHSRIYHIPHQKTVDIYWHGQNMVWRTIISDNCERTLCKAKFQKLRMPHNNSQVLQINKVILHSNITFLLSSCIFTLPRAEFSSPDE